MNGKPPVPVFLIVLSLIGAAAASKVPEGFTEKEVAQGVSSPAGIAIAPDGRVFFGEQEGTVRVLKNNILLSDAALSLKIDFKEERGLLGVALDPEFPASPYLYVYYTALSPASHNRLSRFPVTGDRADSSKEEILLDLPDVGDAVWHMGGGIAFDRQGKLFLGVGEHQKPAESANLASPFGKVLRVNRDGSIPTDNPFYATATGLARAIWAYGLRNPFTLAARPDSGVLVNDVGESSLEEIDIITAGGNFGWPFSEGKSSDPKVIAPQYSYYHADGCAIMGGEFYRPAHASFPAAYAGKYFFTDFCNGWIRAMDPATGKADGFLEQASFPTGLKIAPDGSLYYLSRGYQTGAIQHAVSKVFRVYYGDGSAIRDPGLASRNAISSPRLSVFSPDLSSQAFRIRIDMPAMNAVHVEIRDAQGKTQAMLADLPRFQGRLDLSWSPGPQTAGGVYFAVLVSGGNAWTRAMAALGR